MKVLESTFCDVEILYLCAACAFLQDIVSFDESMYRWCRSQILLRSKGKKKEEVPTSSSLAKSKDIKK